MRYFEWTSTGPTRNDGVCLMATRPVCLPWFFPVGISARTMSPVWKPEDVFGRRAGSPLGDPYVFRFCLWRTPCPHALTSRGRTPSTRSVSGVLAPTHAASSRCVLGSPRVVRLNLVRPPEPVSTGRPVAWSRRRSSSRVELTAAASLSGAWAWALIRFSRSGSFFRKTSTGWFPSRRLQGARQGQVAHAVGAARAARDDVPGLERDVGRVAIRARAVVLLEQVLPRLAAGERAVLVLNSRDRGVLLVLEVELDQLVRRRGDRAEPAQPGDPGEHVGQAAVQRRRQPTLGLRLRLLVPGLGLAPRPAVARRAGPASPTECLACLQRRLDRSAPVPGLDRGDDQARRLWDDGDAGRPRAGTGLDPVLVDGRGLGAPLVEDDREGEPPEDRGSALGQQDPGPRRRARTGRLPVVVENEDSHVC